MTSTFILYSYHMVLLNPVYKVRFILMVHRFNPFVVLQQPREGLYMLHITLHFTKLLVLLQFQLLQGRLYFRLAFCTHQSFQTFI
jgi:hypothetical protein